MQLVRGRGEKHLLSAGAVQIAIGQAVALANEGQCLASVQGLPSGGEVCAGVFVVVHGVVQAYRDAAEGLGEVVEAGQGDLDEVVDGRARQLGHHPEGGSSAGFPALGLKGVSVGYALLV